MSDNLARLQTLLGRARDIQNAASVLTWDQETYMPPGGAEARAQHLATLSELAHEHFTDEEIGTLLDELEPEVRDADPASFEASLVRVTRREYEKARKLPTELVAEMSRATSEAKEAWKQARETDDFATFRPHLDRLVELNLRMAEALGYEEHPYDALLDRFEPEMTRTQVARIFDELKAELVPIVETLREEDPPEDAFLRRHYDPSKQWDFGLEVVRAYGFDLEHGRQDYSTHPFTTNFGPTDVRLTTRVHERYLPSCLFGTLHECGHGLYMQGVDPSLARTPLGGGASLGVHESQSRLWENLVGRSYPFWRHYYPKLQETFPEQLADVDRDAFYRAINKVEPSLIRVEADEVTYNLHVMLRFELETAMLDGDVPIAELPDAWNAKMEEYLGITPSNDAEGVLQDIHWSMGGIGYFPTYALGNLISAQLYRHAQAAIPDLEEQFAAGRFEDLLTWMRENIHQHGSKFTPNELLERVTGGEDIGARDFIDYIQGKYGEIYGSL